VTATPLWFGPDDRPLFGWAHVPESGRASGAAVLCPPLARELTSAHYTYRLLAGALAEAGVLAIRFDYDGTGDSAGGDRDSGRVQAWLSSIAAAVTLARRCGAPSVSLVGMRMGALLAAVAAARDDGVEDVVLWDPTPSGRAFVREQSALQRLRSDVIPLSGDEVELPGFIYSAQTVADLGALVVPEATTAPKRALLLTRPGRRAATELVEPLGVVPELADAAGQDLLLEVEPLYHEVPADAIAAITGWLTPGHGVDSAAVSVPARQAAVMEVEGVSLTERAVWLSEVSMFGIVTEPEERLVAPSILLLNVGNDWHVGPNRLWVDLARRWASMGFRCVRFDQSGLGDSPARPGKPPHVVRLPEAFEDVEAAQDALEPEDPTNVIMVGLCSGGYQALENALIRPARGVYAINPILHFTPPELAWGPMDQRRRICFPSSSLVAAYRRLPGMEPIRRRVRGLAWRAARVLHRERDPSSWLDQLGSDAVRVLVIGGEDEIRPFGPPTSPNEAAAIQIDLVPGLDHALMPAWHREEVIKRMTDHLVRHFLPAETALPSANSA
jgi:pimeloyl-ACP methyl ester carboxylesterase